MTIYPIKQKHVDQFRYWLTKNDKSKMTGVPGVGGNYRATQAKIPAHEIIVVTSEYSAAVLLLLVVIVAALVLCMICCICCCCYCCKAKKLSAQTNPGVTTQGKEGKGGKASPAKAAAKPAGKAPPKKK